jgi:hypothetical protein
MDVLPSQPEDTVLITVDRGLAEVLRIGFHEPHDFTRLRIQMGDGVTPGDVSRALFESGAAVQQSGVEFLISTDWLRRHAIADVGDVAAWERHFARLLAASADEGRYVEPFEAIRVPVDRPSEPADRADGERGGPWRG